jgi:hypothetical protein
MHWYIRSIMGYGSNPYPNSPTQELFYRGFITMNGITIFKTQRTLTAHECAEAILNCISQNQPTLP